MLKRVTAATVFPVTLAEAKLHCRIDGDDENSLLDGLIATANEVIGDDTGLVLGVETWEMTVADVRGQLYLPKAPVATLVSVTSGEDELEGFALSPIGDGKAVVHGPWPSGEVTIRFTAGGDTPLAIKHAMLLLIGHWYAHRETASDKPLREIPFAVESLVARHRRKWVAA